MELKKSSNKILITLSIVWATTLLLLGSWWIYIIIYLSEKNEILKKIAPELSSKRNIISMIKWEGGSFIIILSFLSISILYLFLKDLNRSKALQAFFASLTHELKTPLASIRLQAEVINDTIEKENNPKLTKLSNRLIEDTFKLETQMDKVLQLSRVEQGGPLNLTPVNLSSFIPKIIKKLSKNTDYQIEISEDFLSAQVDEFALELVFRNLIENTIKHCAKKNLPQNFKIKISHQNNNIITTYSDQGIFEGDSKKIGELFYKHNSTQGSGIGLYLCQKLIKKMNGEFTITADKNFTIKIILPMISEVNHE